MLKNSSGISYFSQEVFSVLPIFCEQVEGEPSAYEKVEPAVMQRVCCWFNPLKHWQLQQNKAALFDCVFARSLGAYAHRVFLATSSLGYIMAFYIVMENEVPQTHLL